eukprot:TRINITY_DN11948_c0_g1_i1.p1 TRINITY_DN11948_c0_g1~~TRINITY_DN11948_c0_g1_i1.p1  ORF type:complete len:1564 (+),score=232.20 TRINITY_DN11948_c0_g1_i1:85-4776(+)
MGRIVALGECFQTQSEGKDPQGGDRAMGRIVELGTLPDDFYTTEHKDLVKDVHEISDPEGDRDHGDRDQVQQMQMLADRVISAWLQWSPLPNTRCSQTLTRCFPKAVAGDVAVSRVASMLAPFSFTPANTIYSQSICPDEINNERTGLAHLMSQNWGKCFPMDGIGGVPFAGETGFDAFSAHMPDDGNVLVLFGPRMAISESGVLGTHLRIGQCCESAAYNAVLDACNSLTSGSDQPELEQDDKQHWIRQQVAKSLHCVLAAREQLSELIHEFCKGVEDQLLSIVNTKSGSGSLALVGGIQINLPFPFVDHFEPLLFKVHSGGGSEPVNLLPQFSFRDQLQAGGMYASVMTKAMNVQLIRKQISEVFSWLSWAPPVTSPCHDALLNGFPGALPGKVIVRRCAAALKQFGVTPANSIYCQSMCPEVINNKTGDLAGIMGDLWGSCYPIGGAGGVPTVGRVGFQAITKNVPEGGNIVVLFGPHVAISEQGELGLYKSSGQDQCSPACHPVLSAYASLHAAGGHCGCVASSNRSILGKLHDKAPSLKRMFEDLHKDFDANDKQHAQLRQALRRHLEHIDNAVNPIAALLQASSNFITARIRQIIPKGFEGQLILIGGILVNMPAPFEDHFLPTLFELRRQDKEPVDLMSNFRLNQESDILPENEDAMPMRSLASRGNDDKLNCSDFEHRSGDGETENTVILPRRPSFSFPSQTESEMPEVNRRRELCKSAAACVLNLAVLTAGIVLLLVLSAGQDEADCPDPLLVSFRSCEVCGTGTRLLPLGGDWEKRWPAELRSILYFFGLLWCFLGVNLVCDEFMAAIEEITSRERPVWVQGVHGMKHQVQVRVWNDTLANLSLMALGSSLPEIMLSSVELMGQGFLAGSLGPQTVIGSAAFNLLVITAICISSIPVNEVRSISKMRVFVFTAIVSVLAYLWVVVILVAFTPDKVDIVEGVATLSFFPLFLLVAYYLDRSSAKSGKIVEEEYEKKVLQLQAELQEEYGTEVSLEGVRSVLHHQKQHGQERNMFSRSELRAKIVKSLAGGFGVLGRRGRQGPCFGFQISAKFVLECAGIIQLKVVATKPCALPIAMTYETSDGSAKAGQRYEPVFGTLNFAPNETEKCIDIKLHDNDVWDPPQEFFVDLDAIRVDEDYEETARAHGEERQPRLKRSRCTVWILNDDEPGTLDFDSQMVTVDVGSTEVTLNVTRTHGSHGTITCNYDVEGVTATAGVHFEKASGVLEFQSGQKAHSLVISLFQTPLDPVAFRVTLSDPTEGVLFNRETDGGLEAANCTVTMLGSRENQKVQCLQLACDSEQFAEGMSEWRQRVSDVFLCGGSLIDQSQAGLVDWVLHVVSLFWKVLFLIVPPRSFGNGWPAFWLSMLVIGGITCVINDLASLLGCSLGMPDDVTAISLVALGTSLPDAAASRIAAKQDEDADNSIGNVTGSNCVNVFLGLGISWTIGAVYWHFAGPTQMWRSSRSTPGSKTFEELYSGMYSQGGLIVPAGPIVFSVNCFCVCAILCLSLLAFRRYAYGGELGGPKMSQVRDTSILVLLWLAFIAASVVSVTSARQ